MAGNDIDIVYFLKTLEKEIRKYAVPVVDLIAVQSRDPYRILVGAILSARTRDEVTAGALSRLFDNVPDLYSLAEQEVQTIEKLIFPVGFYKNKARFLKELPAALGEHFGGRIPDTVEALLKLPGVGRKTANLVVSVAFDKPAICVDTHVHRIMNIWAYVQTDNPLQTEMALRSKLPRRLWKKVNRILVAFGQSVCKPFRPHCDICIIGHFCPKIGVTPRKIM